jgi:hypothetical protein
MSMKEGGSWSMIKDKQEREADYGQALPGDRTE